VTLLAVVTVTSDVSALDAASETEVIVSLVASSHATAARIFVPEDRFAVENVTALVFAVVPVAAEEADWRTDQATGAS
jgi:hypothetical protein